MKVLWAPWRIEYILGEKEKGCVFCKADDPHAELTLFRGSTTLVLMNKFPYNNGHLLVAPRRHVAGLDELTAEETGALLKTIERSVAALKSAMKPDGFNIGLNLGRVAGAGIEEHLHFHVVPRWFGDTNALAVIDEVRVIPQHLKETWSLLKPHFERKRGEAAASGPRPRAGSGGRAAGRSKPTAAPRRS